MTRQAASLRQSVLHRHWAQALQCYYERHKARIDCKRLHRRQQGEQPLVGRRREVLRCLARQPEHPACCTYYKERRHQGVLTRSVEGRR